MKKLLFTLAILWLVPRLLYAQLSGSYIIGPTQTYTSIASIISDLNAQGVSGNVTISVPANYVETTPAGGFVLGSTILNASLNSTSTLQFVKSGVGNNPLIYGAPGQYATTNIYGLSDVIWAINGCDYVSVDGIDLCDSTNNSTLATANEIGFGFYKLNASAPFDGCQHNRIQNCSIRLQGYTVTGSLSIKSAGIFVFCKTRNGGTLSSGQVGMVLTNSNDASSFNQFYSNRISGASCGIYLGGSAGTYAYWDTDNDIGGNSSSTGNYIYNFGNDGSSLGIYAGFGQSNTNISYNTIDNTLAASPSLSANYLGTLTGISFVAQLTNQIALNRQVRARGNTISIGYASSITGNYIRRFSGMSFSVSNEDLLIDSNSIYFNNPYAVLTSADCYGIDFGGGNASTKAVVANNKISGFVRLNQNFNGINNFNSNFENVLVSANDIDVDMESNISSGFYYRGIRVLNASVISNYNIIRNTFHDVQLYTTSNFTAGAIELTFDGCKNLHIDSNVISNFGSSKFGSPVTGISLSYSHLDTFECSYNSISNLKGGYSLIGIWDKPSSFLANVVVDVHHNSIEHFRSTCDDITNVAYYRNANPGSFYFHHNIIKDISDTLFSTQLNQLAGLYFKGDYRDTFKRALIYNNIVSIGNSKAGLNEPSNMIGNMAAILIAKGDHNKLEFVNNTMSVFGGLKNRNAYSSIIRNKGTDTILLKNNILANYCEWDVTYPQGYIADLIFDTSLAVLSSASNNNSYFLKSLHNHSSTIALIAHQTMDSIGSFLTYVAPRESNSFYEEPPFASMDHLSPNFCQFSSSVMTQNESGGTSNLPISLLDDVFGNPRFGAANYTGLGTGLDIGAYEMECASYVNPLQLVSAQISPASTGCNASTRTVTCSLTVASGFVLSTVQLIYCWNGSMQTPIAMTNVGSNNWSVTLPIPSPASAIVRLYIEAYCTNGNFVRSSVSTYQEAAFSSNSFQILGSNTLGCGNNSTSLSVFNQGDSTIAIPSGYGISMPFNIGYGDILNISLQGNGSYLNNTSTYTSTGGPASNGLMNSLVGQYSNFTGSVSPINLLAGSTYSLSFTVANKSNSGLFFGAFLLYIDLNRNGFFDLPTECLYTLPYTAISSGLADSATYFASITIPSLGVSSGKTLMRAVFTRGNFYSPCNVYSMGETEDYIVNLSAPSSPQYSYSWSDNAVGFGSNASMVNYSNSQLGNHTIQVVITDNATCQAVDTFILQVINSLNINLSPSTSNTLCRNDSLILTVAYTGITPSYTWFYNGALIPNVLGQSYTAHQPGDYFVWFSNGTCTDSTNHVLVNYYPSPATSYSANVLPNDTICSGQPISIHVSGLSAMSWTPNYSNGSIITPQQSTQYSVSGMDANNCFYQDSFNIHVDTVPSNIVIAGNPVISTSAPIFYAVNSVAGQSYQWLINGGSIVNGQGTNSIGVLWSSGSPTYSLGVIVANASGCADTFNLALSFSNGLNDFGSNGINLYPSPASSTITFTLSANSIGNKPYRIENVLGQVLLRGEYLGRETRVDVSSLIDGIYYLKLDHNSMPFVVGH